MKCPHCGTIFAIPDVVAMNVDTYSRSALIAAPCCKRGITISQERRLVANSYHGNAKEDDWGEPIL